MEYKLRIAGCINDSIADGPGLRYAVFVQGCPHGCTGCHNPATHDFNGGYLRGIDEILADIEKNPLLDGITLSGGEPFCQAKPLAALACAVRPLGLNVICYTGYRFEYLAENQSEENGFGELLDSIDILVDGKFDLNLRTLELRFRGSSNQRVIDVKASLLAGQTVETDF